MPDSLVVDRFVDFQHAASCAKKLAQRFSCSVDVQRTDTEFLVKAPQPVFLALKRFDEEERDEADDEYWQQCMYDQWQEERDLLAEEISDSQDEWARSNEEGWFYAD